MHNVNYKIYVKFNIIIPNTLIIESPILVKTYDDDTCNKLLRIKTSLYVVCTIYYITLLPFNKI